MLRIESRKKANRQSGFVVTVELLLITVVLVVGLVTGMTKLRDQTIAELSDTGSAIGSINQSYSVEGTVWSEGTPIAETSGFAFQDAGDIATPASVGGDASLIIYTVAPTPSTSVSTTGEDVPQYVTP
jgi:hypothetical protein